MNQRERIVHHEAAHAVVALAMGLPTPSSGINIDRENPETGGLGSYFATLFFIEDLTDLTSLALEEAQAKQLKYACFNLMAILAGAASDSRVLGEDPMDSLSQQPGDRAAAVDILVKMAVPFHDHEESLLSQMSDAVTALGETEIWAAVEKVAAATLATGQLTGEEIERIAKPHLAAWLQRVKAEKET